MENAQEVSAVDEIVLMIEEFLRRNPNRNELCRAIARSPDCRIHAAWRLLEMGATSNDLRCIIKHVPELREECLARVADADRQNLLALLTYLPERRDELMRRLIESFDDAGSAWSFLTSHLRHHDRAVLESAVTSFYERFTDLDPLVGLLSGRIGRLGHALWQRVAAKKTLANADLRSIILVPSLADQAAERLLNSDPSTEDLCFLVENVPTHIVLAATRLLEMSPTTSTLSLLVRKCDPTLREAAARLLLAAEPDKSHLREIVLAVSAEDVRIAAATLLLQQDPESADFVRRHVPQLHDQIAMISKSAAIKLMSTQDLLNALCEKPHAPSPIK